MGDPFHLMGHDKRAPPKKLRKDVLVTSVFLGGTRLSGPLFDVGLSIPLYRGLKSRAESGAEAPHSMECGDLSPLFSEGFSLHNLGVDLDGNGLPVGVEPDPPRRPPDCPVPPGPRDAAWLVFFPAKITSASPDTSEGIIERIPVRASSQK